VFGDVSSWCVDTDQPFARLQVSSPGCCLLL